MNRDIHLNRLGVVQIQPLDDDFIVSLCLLKKTTSHTICLYIPFYLMLLIKFFLFIPVWVEIGKNSSLECTSDYESAVWAFNNKTITVDDTR